MMEFWSALTAIGTIASAVALIVTICYIKQYTESTERMHQETKRAVELQTEEIGLSQRPVIRIGCPNPKEMNFEPSVTNVSSVHAKVRIKATISGGQEKIELQNTHPYSGVPVWPLQAGGIFKGNLGLHNLVVGKTSESWRKSGAKYLVTFEVWAVNHQRDEDELSLPENKSPLVQWFWDWNRECWIVEMPPNESILK